MHLIKCGQQQQPLSVLKHNDENLFCKSQLVETQKIMNEVAIKTGFCDIKS